MWKIDLAYMRAKDVQQPLAIGGKWKLVIFGIIDQMPHKWQNNFFVIQACLKVPQFFIGLCTLHRIYSAPNCSKVCRPTSVECRIWSKVYTPPIHFIYTKKECAIISYSKLKRLRPPTMITGMFGASSTSSLDLRRRGLLGKSEIVEPHSGLQVSKKHNFSSPLTRKDSILWGAFVTEI